MSEWEKVTHCPHCGGPLTISVYYSFSRDYKITRKGVLSKRSSLVDGGLIDCITAFCSQCQTAWDSDHVCVESDNTVWVKE